MNNTDDPAVILRYLHLSYASVIALGQRPAYKPYSVLEGCHKRLFVIDYLCAIDRSPNCLRYSNRCFLIRNKTVFRLI